MFWSRSSSWKEAKPSFLKLAMFLNKLNHLLLDHFNLLFDRTSISSIENSCREIFCLTESTSRGWRAFNWHQMGKRRQVWRWTGAATRRRAEQGCSVLGKGVAKMPLWHEFLDRGSIILSILSNTLTTFYPLVLDLIDVYFRWLGCFLI